MAGAGWGRGILAWAVACSIIGLPMTTARGAGFPSPPVSHVSTAPAPQPEPIPPRPGYRPEVGSVLEIASVSPQPATYGVGIIVTIRFSQSVPWALRREVVSRLKVKSSKPLGASGWAWRDSATVLFRPRKFWPAYAKVQISTRADYAVLGQVVQSGADGQQPLRWGGSINQTFRTGRSQIVNVNARTNRAAVVRDGQTIRTMGVSLGKPGWDTRSGIKVLMDKYYVKRMTSQSIGAEDEYVLDVPYAIRMTDSGEFIHAAPWAVNRIGRWNGSHGCTNLFTYDAQWLFNTRLYGDPVVTTGTNRYMTSDNGMGGPWNVDWSLWRTGRLR